mgnify:FL=1
MGEYYLNRHNIAGHRIRIARYMHRPRLTQKDLAGLMYIRHNILLTQNAISHIENGQRYITDLELTAFSRVLEVSIAWLLGEANDPTPEKRTTRRSITSSDGSDE